GEMLSPLLDGVEDDIELREMRRVLPDEAGRVDQGRDGSGGVVELVADDPDDLAQHVDFAPRDLEGELSHQEQRVRLAIEGEGSARQVIRLLLAVDLHGEELVGLAEKREAQRLRGFRHEPEEVFALRRGSLEEQASSL